MGYFKNQVIEMQIEEADRKPMVYVSTRVFYLTMVGVWLMAALTGLMVGLVL